MDEAKRFRHAHQLASYLGLVPVEDTSGERDKRRLLGAITKESNAYMRLRIGCHAMGAKSASTCTT
ncbi:MULTISPECIES: transposase [Sorangium]|uniref:transposase n=1 Tax=Sorangium TaxID=39643 RepID=UPI00101A690B|nr:MULTISPECIES: transposase [Sorangium]